MTKATGTQTSAGTPTTQTLSSLLWALTHHLSNHGRILARRRRSNDSRKIHHSKIRHIRRGQAHVNRLRREIVGGFRQIIRQSLQKLRRCAAHYIEGCRVFEGILREKAGCKQQGVSGAGEGRRVQSFSSITQVFSSIFSPESRRV